MFANDMSVHKMSWQNDSKLMTLAKCLWTKWLDKISPSKWLYPNVSLDKMTRQNDYIQNASWQNDSSQNDSRQNNPRQNYVTKWL